MIPFKFLTKNIQRTRECAVIASSVQDFNNWRRGIFDRVFVITNREFVHTNENYNVTTRYRAITNMDDCQGLIFDDYTKTDRIQYILSSIGYPDTVDHIRQLITEVRLNLREDE